MTNITNLQSYLSGTGNILYLTPVFTYSIEITRIHRKYVELLYSSYKYSLDFIKLNKNISYKHYKSYTDVISIELYGAPKKYLIKNGYKPVNIDDYKLLIKEKRKHGKIRNR